MPPNNLDAVRCGNGKRRKHSVHRSLSDLPGSYISQGTPSSHVAFNFNQGEVRSGHDVANHLNAWSIPQGSYSGGSDLDWFGNVTVGHLPPLPVDHHTSSDTVCQLVFDSRSSVLELRNSFRRQYGTVASAFLTVFEEAVIREYVSTQQASRLTAEQPRVHSSSPVPPVPGLRRSVHGGKAAQLCEYMIRHCINNPAGMEQVNLAMRDRLLDSGTKSDAVQLVLETRPDVRFERRGRVWQLVTVL